MGKRQEAAQLTRSKLLAAAEKLIEEQGFEQVTVDDIARGAGVAKGTFYTYFKRKEDVVSAIYYQNFDVLREQALALPGEVCDKLAWFLTQSMHYIAETGLRIAQQWLKNGLESQQARQCSGSGLECQAKLNYDRQVIAELLEQGGLPADAPLERLTEWVAAEYYGALLCWCIMDGAGDPAALLRDFCQIQLKNSLAVYQKQK